MRRYSPDQAEMYEKLKRRQFATAILAVIFFFFFFSVSVNISLLKITKTPEYIACPVEVLFRFKFLINGCLQIYTMCVRPRTGSGRTTISSASEQVSDLYSLSFKRSDSV